jgi:hypothetical protein
MFGALGAAFGARRVRPWRIGGFIAISTAWAVFAACRTRGIRPLFAIGRFIAIGTFGAVFATFSARCTRGVRAFFAIARLIAIRLTRAAAAACAGAKAFAACRARGAGFIERHGKKSLLVSTLP